MMTGQGVHTMTATTDTTRDFVIRHDIRATVESADANPNMANDDWAATANHYRVTLRRGRQRMTTYFSMGSAHLDGPDAAGVLDSLASDAASVQDAASFEDWAFNCGYDPDSIRAQRTYQTIIRQAARLQRLLGVDLYLQLLNETERL
jgi:hypothetical protein